tara:strand:+ start:1016 stop:1312 length:297 start_codon:yes stop_codon:yes gene_type:complete
MGKIEYKIKKGSKSESKELILLELNWGDFCKSTDLAIKCENPNGEQFTNVSKLIQLHTGKTDQDMMEWKNKCDSHVDFLNEIIIVMRTISEHYESKKK